MTRGQRLREVLNWVNGSTALGLLIAHTGGAKLARHDAGLWVASGYRGIAAKRAFTVGNVVLTRHDARTFAERPALRAHEARHSDQWALLGPLFVPLYYTEALISWALTGDDAAGNAFEVHAGLRDGGYARRPLQRRPALTPRADRPGPPANPPAPRGRAPRRRTGR